MSTMLRISGGGSIFFTDNFRKNHSNHFCQQEEFLMFACGEKCTALVTLMPLA